MPTHITLPIPPSVNHYWKTRKGGKGRYISAEGQAFKETVGLRCAETGLEPMEGRVKLTIAVYRPADRGDLDNYLKALLDGIKGYAYLDDKQVYVIHARKDMDRENPRVELTIEGL
jgi:crossover junction endodeoxyribonuclease RusA